MLPITISLDAKTHKLAKEKTNFSSWVRDKLRSERNQQPIAQELAEANKQIEFLEKQSDLFYHLLMEARAAIGTLQQEGDAQ
jgi:hypothetical protein